jgi:hypothetical protein
VFRRFPNQPLLFNFGFGKFDGFMACDAKPVLH